MNGPHCLTCGRPIKRRVVCSYAEWRRRKYCNMDCRRAHSTAKSPLREVVFTAGRLDDVQLLLDAGESPHQIAARLGLRIGLFARWLDNYGRSDLARLFWRVDWSERNRHSRLQEAS